MVWYGMVRHLGLQGSDIHLLPWLSVDSVSRWTDATLKLFSRYQCLPELPLTSKRAVAVRWPVQLVCGSNLDSLFFPQSKTTAVASLS